LGRPPPTEEEIKEELKRLDINKDGKLDKKEFETLVKDLVNFCVETL
jgi:Ca2+-binding EF-hand superfamily protein